MSSLINTFLKQVFQGDQIKDWDHASRLFVANNYELAPKNSWLFHVFFDLNRGANGIGSVSVIRQIELGMLVKQVGLPKFDIQTKTYNAYNRSNIVQTRMNYSPVTITFHDDAMDIVKNFWFDYYNYYYRDSDNTEQIYRAAHGEMSGPRQTSNWGYTPRGSAGGINNSEPYLSSIRIYSMFNKKFSEYILLNPMIKSFQHGEHNTSSGSDTMTHTMTVEYEAVTYNTGRVGPGAVKGFGELHYDKRPSPLTPAGGGTSSILGQGGILETGTDILNDIQNGNFGSAIFKTGRFSTTLKGANFKAMAVSEAMKMGKDIVSGATSPNSKFVVPSVGSAYDVPSAINTVQSYNQTVSSSFQGVRTLIAPLSPSNINSTASSVASSLMKTIIK